MQHLYGEYECKIDTKGRMRLPSNLLKKFGEKEEHNFILNRGADGCLLLFSMEVWEKEVERINNLDKSLKKNRDYIRYFFRGVQDVSTDSADRILLSKRLLDYAGITKEVILTAHSNYVEIWDVKRYEESNPDPDYVPKLEQEVLGGMTTNNDDE